MEYRREPTSSQQEDQYGEAKACDAIKTEELQIDSVLPVEEDVRDTQPAFIIVEQGNDTSVENTSEISQKDYRQPTSPAYTVQHDGDDQTRQDGTKEKSCDKKIPKNVQCDECGQEYAHSQSLYRHQRKEHGQAKLQRTVEKLQCDQCERQFLHKGSLAKHKQNFHGKIWSRACSGCGINFASSSIHKHEMECSTNPNFLSCDECGKKFMKEFYLLKHKQTCSELLNQQCNGCELHFLTRDALRHHQKKFQCGSKFLSRNEQSSTENRVYVSCDKCARKFTTNNLLLRHSRNCRQLHQCKECERCFTCKSKLIQHKQKAHGEVFKQKCDKCDVELSIYSMRRHKMKCDGSTLSCDKCGLKFHKGMNLILHTLNCGKKPIQCDECGQRFVLRKSLRRHKQIAHEKIPPKACDKCGKVLSIFSMQRHKGICKGGSKTVSCDECDKKFATMGSLQKHKEINHKSTLLPEPAHENIDKHEELELADTPNLSRIDESPQIDAMFLAEDGNNLNSQSVVIESNHKNEIAITGTTQTSSNIQCDECGQIFIHSQLLTEHKRVSHGHIFSQMCKNCGIKIPLDKTQNHIRLCTGLAEEASTSYNSSNMATSNNCGQDCAHLQSLNRQQTLYHGQVASQMCKNEVSESTAELLLTGDSPYGAQHSDVEDDSEVLNTQPAKIEAVQGNSCSNIVSETGELQESVGNPEEIAHKLQLAEHTSETSRSKELLRIDSMHPVQNTPHFNSALAQFDEGNGDSYVIIKTESNPDLVESNQGNSYPHVITEETNPTIVELNPENSNKHFVIKTEISEDDDTLLETNDSLNSEPPKPVPDMQCDECEQVFSDKPSLQKHKNSAHAFRTCDKCDVAFSLKAVQRHKRRCKGNSSSVSCYECGKKFSTLVSMLKHKRNLHDLKSSVEPTRKIPDDIQTETQVDVIKTEEIHIVSILPAIEEDDSDLNTTSAFTYTDQRNISASITEITRDSCSSLDVINSSSTVEQPNLAAGEVRCDECGKRFISAKTLRIHMKAAHEASTPTCEKCGITFSLYAIRKHRLLCKGQTLFSVSCDECGKKFVTKKSLFTHLRVSHGITEASKRRRPIPAASRVHCDECGQSFSSATVLKKHVDVAHRGDTRMCYQCGNDFTPQAILKHRRLCKGPRPSVSCDECGKKFTKPSSLFSHQQVCHQTAQEFSNDLKVANEQVDVIKTEELHIESILPAIEEDITDLNATFPRTCTDQEADSSGTVTQLARDDPALPDVIDSSGNVERPGPAASKLQCNECGHSFTQKNTLRRHILVAHRGSTQTCEQCDHEFNPYAIHKHRQSCKGQRAFSVSCDKCGKKFTTTASLFTHRQVSHGITKAPLLRRLATAKVHCDKCGRSFCSVKSMKTHKKVAHEGYTWPCQRCGNELSLYAAPRHRRSCKGPKRSVSCDECGKKFTKTASLMTHQQISHGVIQECTSDLRKAEEQEDAIKTEQLHVESLHATIEENVSDLKAQSASTETDQEITSSSIIMELSQDDCALPDVINDSSTVDRPNSAVCKVYNVRRKSTRKCEQCGNEYRLKSMQKHRLSCKGPTLYSVSCDECGKKFSRTTILLTHRQVVHGITEAPGPATCDECGKSFTRMTSLRRHINVTHKGIKRTRSSLGATRRWRPVPATYRVHCDECGQSFTRKSSLRRHINVSHRGFKRKRSSHKVVQEQVGVISTEELHVESLPAVKEEVSIETYQVINSSSNVTEQSRDDCELPEVC